MSNLQLEYRPDELLATHEVAEPLLAGGVRCHGGFLADGTYVSPRTRFRLPAIDAWQRHHRETFGTAVLDAPLATWPGAYPNVEQARFLLRSGIRRPMIMVLTRIGTAEGLGAMIRHLSPSDLQPHFVEDIRGTALAHLNQGLIEAHARDEAGWEGEAGHDRMWYAARDLAFEHPVVADQTEATMARLGLTGTGAPPRILSGPLADVDLGLELLFTTMIRVLFIELKAFHVFAWAEEVLSDTDLVAGEGEAARIVSYIRSDERPHVEYLRTALTEARDRTVIGTSGRRHPGTEVIGTLWDALLAESRTTLEERNRAAALAEVERALRDRPGGGEVLEEFHALGEGKDRQ
jgi:hypothetical protein